MFYFDDILNVNAYLRSKMKKNVNTTQELLDKCKNLNIAFDTLRNQADDLFLEAQQLANNMGVDISDIVSMQSDKEYPEIASCSELLVEIPDKFDFSIAFKELCEEAHAAGFTDVHPEDLLSAEEMKHAEDFSNALDSRFRAETGLSSKDMNILNIAIAIRVFWHYTIVFLFPRTETENINNFKSNGLICSMADNTSGVPRIRNESQIINEGIPFDLPDNKYFSHSDILGFHPWLGWLIGVINILTNTVTTQKMESYSVTQSLYEPSLPEIEQKIPTFFHLLVPILCGFFDNKESILAAVVREASVLHPANTPVDDVSFLVKKAIEFEKSNQNILNKAQIFSDVLPNNDMTEDVSFIFINKLITAIHAIYYNPDVDGNVQMYAVRTNKILTISSAIAALIDSIPAAVSRDVSQVDFGSIVTTCLNAFNSIRFWVEAKTNYLVSEYKKEIDEQMKILDKYIKVSSE